MYIILLLVIIGFVILLGFLLAPGREFQRIHLRHFGKQWKVDAGLSWMYI